MKKGFIHIYCGEGKGKTSAAVGAAVRYAGHGGKVLFFQFMKRDSSGEREALDKITGINLLKGYDKIKLSNKMTDEEKKTAAEFYEKKLKEIKENARKYDIIILDEAINAVRLKYMRKESIIAFLDEKPDNTEVILTGRGYDEDIWARGDYITEMKKVKHPYDKGIKGREGIEW